MGEDAESRPGSSTAKTRDAAKKRAALWKKQVKSFKLKDVGKKVEAVRFCVQDERFFREQPEVLPLAMGFFTRTKTPELVLETLSVLQTLLSPPPTETIDSIHADVNAAFMLERSTNADSAWRAGEPFVALFSSSVLAVEIRVKAIEVFDLLLRASVVSAEEAPATLLQFQTAGSPCSALLGCLGVDNIELQLAALGGLRDLLQTPPDEAFLVKFEGEKGLSRVLEFIAHPERRFHRPALDIVEKYSQSENGRACLQSNGAANVLCGGLQEAHKMMLDTSAIILSSGVNASPLLALEAPMLCANIAIICQVFVRAVFSRGQVLGDQDAMRFEVIDAMIGILRYDITSALTPVAAPTESPRATHAAAAAATNAAATNAAAIAALLPFSSDRSIAIISSLGRMVERCERCKAHAKARGLLPVLLDCFKLKDVENLHQVADKLLHLSVFIADGGGGEGRPASKPRIDPNILCAVATEDAVAPSDCDEQTDPASTGANAEKAPLVAVENVLSLLGTSHSTGSTALAFRQVRWIAALVDLPGNASALGDRGITLFLQMLADSLPDDKLQFAFLAKCVHAIALQHPSSLELCGTSDLDPSAAWFSFLQRERKAAESEAEGDSIVPAPSEAPSVGDAVPISSLCKLEWTDELQEQSSFPPNPLTDRCHDVDVYLSVSDALVGLTKAFLQWNAGALTTDFHELLAAKLDAEHAAAGKPGIPASAPSKKKLHADQPKATVGESIMLSILEKGLEVPKLLALYTAVNAPVCVSLLTLLNNLMTVPGGLKVLLHQASTQLHSVMEKCASSESLPAASEWPLSVGQCAQTEHALLILPVMEVLQSPQSCFMEVEAAVRSIAMMTSDVDPSEKEAMVQSPDPVAEAPKSPNKVSAAAVTAPPGVPELVVCESDRFVNVGLGSGLLVLLLSFLDGARVPSGDGLSGRMTEMQRQVEEMVHQFISLAQRKQEIIRTKYREKIEREKAQHPDIPLEAVHDDELELPYQRRWAELLLDEKFSVSRFGYVGYSALLLAVELVLPKTVDSLLDAGASSNTSSPEGTTPLMTAFLVGNEQIAKTLLSTGADVDAITGDGCDLSVWNCALISPVGTSVSERISTAYSNNISTEPLVQLDSIAGSPQLLQLCLQVGMDVNVSSVHGDFLLHALLSSFTVRRRLRGLALCFRYDSRRGDEDALKSMVEELIHTHSANVNSCNCQGQTPLHLALLYGHTAMVKTLLLNGANPNIRDQNGQLPLHYACLAFCGSPDGSDGQAIEVVRLLLEMVPKYPCTLGAHSDLRKHKSVQEKQALAIEDILDGGLQSVIRPGSIVERLATVQQMLETATVTGHFLPWQFACGAHVQLPSVLVLDDDMQKWLEANGQARAALLRYLHEEWRVDSSNASGRDAMVATGS